MFLYNLVVLLYGLVIRIAAVKKRKAQQWVNGRKNWESFYRSSIQKTNSKEIVWIHCASYGEFEQGRPLIEKIRQRYPQVKIVLTFFSPSGYEEVKNWQGADVIGYLPLDTKRNAETFISIVKPAAAIFIKYEFWLNFLNALKKYEVKTYLVSAVFKPHHPFFKWYGGMFRKSLGTFNKLFIQDHASGKLLESIGIKNYEVAGDTRFDRVLEIKENFIPIDLIAKFCSGHKVLVAGSTWPDDEKLLIDVLKKLPANTKLIFAPHEISETSVKKLISRLNENGISFSLYSEGTTSGNEQVLVVNAFGVLSKLYHYCDVAYIGGGFGDGIHNCLEAAVYLKPVVFYGNTHHKYNEAVELISIGAAKNVMSEEEASAALNFYLDGSSKNEVESKLQHYFAEKSGTTEKVMKLLNLKN
jgi:3-deoxy-D-manno-octulosonic-acid transferase